MTSYIIAGLVVGAVVFYCLGKALGWCVGSPWYAARQRRQILNEVRRNRGRS